MKNNIENAAKRKPTLEEIEKITRYIENYNIYQNKTHKVYVIICFILGIIFLLSIITKTSPSIILSVSLSLLSFWFSKFFSERIKFNLEEIEAIKNGEFLIIDGFVSETSSGSHKARKIMIWFTSNTNDFNVGWYPIIRNNVSVGTKILYVDSKPLKARKKKFYLFSDFMLSDEGYKVY